MASYIGTSAGLYGALRSISGAVGGFYRAANDALARYELYKGTDASPDFSGAPLETFAGLPHETAATLAADHAYHLVLRKRNAYNLLSQNIAETLIEIDAGGDQVAVRPSDPQAVTVAPAAGGKAAVEAMYSNVADGDNAADTWLIYLTNDGGDPEPGVDEPETEAMIFRGGIAILDWLSGAEDDETVIKILVRTRRVDAGPVNIDSIGTTIHTITANTDGPDLINGGIFIRIDMEQAQ